MKWTSYFSKKVEMMPHLKSATLASSAILLFALPTFAAAQATSPSRELDLPVCSGIAGPVIDTRTQTLPATAQEREVEMGQVLLDATPIVIRAGTLDLKSPATFSGRFLFTDFTVTIQPGPTATDASGNHRPTNYEVRYGSELRPRTGSGRPNVRLEVGAGNQLNGILEVSGGQRYPIEGASFEVSECYLTTASLVRRQLIYAGVSRGVVTLEYRELSGNTVRTAFTRTLTYDLNEGDIIGVQGARLRVISANNVGLRYVVLQTFSN